MKELRENSTQNGLLYHLDYWDGPISGVCLYNGQKCYFHMIREIFDEEDEDLRMDDNEWNNYCQKLLDSGYVVDPEERHYTKWYRIFAIYRK